MSINMSLNRLAAREDLNHVDALACFKQMFQGDLSPAQSGAFLFGLKSKGETPDELNAAVLAALEEARLVQTKLPKTIDTCGTGGDGKKSFNCSTAVALFLADMGYKVVKHGNKGVSSNCGSADVIDFLGIPFFQEEAEALSYLEDFNFTFLFAPYFHPAFANIASIRKELGIPTLFNLIGPLLNPARPSHQLLGVGHKKYLPLIAKALAMTKVEQAAVIHGAGGFDELTPCGPSEVIFVQNGQCRPAQFEPQKLGLRPCNPEELCYPDKNESLTVMRSVLQGQGPQPVRDMVCLNLALAIYLLEDGLPLEECLVRAGQKLNQGIINRSFYA